MITAPATSLEIMPERGGPPLILPFTARACRWWMCAGGRIVIDPPAATDGEPPPGAAEWIRMRIGGAGMTWRATVLTLFPDMFPGPLGLRWPAARWKTGSGRSTRVTSATLRPTGIAPLTTRRSAAAPAW